MAQGSYLPSQTVSTSETPTMSAQEILQTLEASYQETSRNLATVRESLTKSQEAVIAAQDASFKAYHLLSINKERHLINLIGQHQQQHAQCVQELEKVKQLYQNLLSRQLPVSTSSQFLPSDSTSNFLTMDQLKSRQDNIAT